ncbi:bifunctional DNA primase/polymerase [Streptomyces rimosus]|uniref:bifunctional DNA primase/polymerase n=1 Tax=Streptomyces rimosus TaxID=1927 RepID=UPI0037D212F6
MNLHGQRDDAAFLADVVYVGRPLNKGGWNLAGHPLANPFPLTRDASRAEVVERYRAWLADRPDLVARELPALRGKRLGCWCPEGQPCHARVLAELLNKAAPDGATAFQTLCERAGQPVPDTYRVRTASGGTHLYFTAPDGVRLSNTAGTLAPLVDTRAWGGYVVGAGSTTAAGAYEVLDDVPVAPLPGWLLDALTPAQQPVRPPVPVRVPRGAARCAQVALERETAAVAAAQEGGREAALFASARKLGRFVAWGDIPRHVVEEAFQSAAESTGLPPHQCRSTLRSALNWSIRTARPRETA